MTNTLTEATAVVLQENRLKTLEVLKYRRLVPSFPDIAPPCDISDYNAFFWFLFQHLQYFIGVFPELRLTKPRLLAPSRE